MGYVGNSPHAFISYVESGKKTSLNEREPELVAAFNQAYRLKYGEDLNLKRNRLMNDTFDIIAPILLHCRYLPRMDK